MLRMVILPKALEPAKFPRVMKGFRNMRNGKYAERIPVHDWAQIEDMSTDFKVHPPSGATLIYIRSK